MQLVDPALDPEQVVARREEASAVWRAIGAMPESHRHILVPRDFHDLAYSEIAEVLGIPVGTVMSRLHAARGSLRRLVEKGAHQDDG